MYAKLLYSVKTAYSVMQYLSGLCMVDVVASLLVLWCEIVTLSNACAGCFRRAQWCSAIQVIDLLSRRC